MTSHRDYTFLVLLFVLGIGTCFIPDAIAGGPEPSYQTTAAATAALALKADTSMGNVGSSSIHTALSVLPIANGGTGQTASSAALSALGGMKTDASNAATTSARLNLGIPNHNLVTVDASGNASVTGTLTLGTALPISSGGTGQTASASAFYALAGFKVAYVTGTTPADVSSYTRVDIPVDSTKIVGISAIVNDTPTGGVSPGFMDTSGYSFRVSYDANYIYLGLNSGGGCIRSAPFRVMLFYTE